MQPGEKALYIFLFICCTNSVNLKSFTLRLKRETGREYLRNDFGRASGGRMQYKGNQRLKNLFRRNPAVFLDQPYNSYIEFANQQPVDKQYIDLINNDPAYDSVYDYSDPNFDLRNTREVEVPHLRQARNDGDGFKFRLARNPDESIDPGTKDEASSGSEESGATSEKKMGKHFETVEIQLSMNSRPPLTTTPKSKLPHLDAYDDPHLLIDELHQVNDLPLDIYHSNASEEGGIDGLNDKWARLDANDISNEIMDPQENFQLAQSIRNLNDPHLAKAEIIKQVMKTPARPSKKVKRTFATLILPTTRRPQIMKIEVPDTIHWGDNEHATLQDCEGKHCDKRIQLESHHGAGPEGLLDKLSDIFQGHLDLAETREKRVPVPVSRLSLSGLLNRPFRSVVGSPLILSQGQPGGLLIAPGGKFARSAMVVPGAAPADAAPKYVPSVSPRKISKDHNLKTRLGHTLCQDPAVLHVEPLIYFESVNSDPKLISRTGVYYRDVVRKLKDNIHPPPKYGQYNLLYSFEQDVIVNKILVMPPLDTPRNGYSRPPDVRELAISISIRDYLSKEWGPTMHYTIPLNKNSNPNAVALLEGPTRADAVRISPGYKDESRTINSYQTEPGGEIEQWNWANFKFKGCLP